MHGLPHLLLNLDTPLKNLLDILKDYRLHAYEYLSFKLKYSLHRIEELTYFLIYSGFLVELKKKNTIIRASLLD